VFCAARYDIYTNATSPARFLQFQLKRPYAATERSHERTSQNSLADAERYVDLSFVKISSEGENPVIQVADPLCASKIVNVRRSDDSASPTVELCLSAHTAASTASRTEKDVDQAIVSVSDLAGLGASCTKPYQAMILIVAPAISDLSPVKAAIISASEQENETREYIGRAMLKLLQLS
jgi:hypothetical protein